MTPAEHAMPIVTATWVDGYGWSVDLPDGRRPIADDRETALALIDAEACGAAIRWIGGPTPRSAPEPDLARLGAESRDVGPVPAEAPDMSGLGGSGRSAPPTGSSPATTLSGTGASLPTSPAAPG